MKTDFAVVPPQAELSFPRVDRPAGARRIKPRPLKITGWERVLDPKSVFVLAGRIIPWARRGTLLLLGSGFALSLLQAVHGVSQLGMLHLPAAWLATLLLVAVAFWSAIGLILNRSIPLEIAEALVPTGAMFTFLALWSGSLWMRAVEGVWWMGDPRQAAEALMFAVYMVMLAVPLAISNRRRASRAVGVFALLGAGQVVLFFFLADGWIRLTEEPRSVLLVDIRLLWPMLLVAGGFWLYATYVCLVRLRCLIKERELGLSEVFSPR